MSPKQRCTKRAVATDGDYQYARKRTRTARNRVARELDRLRVDKCTWKKQPQLAQQLALILVGIPLPVLMIAIDYLRTLAIQFVDNDRTLWEWVVFDRLLKRSVGMDAQLSFWPIERPATGSLSSTSNSSPPCADDSAMTMFVRSNLTTSPTFSVWPFERDTAIPILPPPDIGSEETFWCDLAPFYLPSKKWLIIHHGDEYHFARISIFLVSDLLNPGISPIVYEWGYQAMSVKWMQVVSFHGRETLVAGGAHGITMWAIDDVEARARAGAHPQVRNAPETPHKVFWPGMRAGVDQAPWGCVHSLWVTPEFFVRAHNYQTVSACRIRVPAIAAVRTNSLDESANENEKEDEAVDDDLDGTGRLNRCLWTASRAKRWRDNIKMLVIARSSGDLIFIPSFSRSREIKCRLVTIVDSACSSESPVLQTKPDGDGDDDDTENAPLRFSETHKVILDIAPCGSVLDRHIYSCKLLLDRYIVLHVCQTKSDVPNPTSTHHFSVFDLLSVPLVNIKDGGASTVLPELARHILPTTIKPTTNNRPFELCGAHVVCA